jgi:hypothetical protein
MRDLSEFAQRNSNLVPLEVEPLVAALKESLAAKDLKRSSTAFATLQARLEEVPEFRQFRTTREEARKDAAKAELDELTETVRTTSEFIESYVRRNITSDSAQDLLKLRSAVSEALVTPEPEALKLAISKCESEFDRLRVLAEYHDYRAKHPRQSRRSLPATTHRKSSSHRRTSRRNSDSRERKRPSGRGPQFAG